jgi:DNA replication protein DnaC
VRTRRHRGQATAILDRRPHECHVLDIKCRSYRLRELERSAKERR